MNQTEAMRAYVRVAELASFTQAANNLGLPKAGVSMAVRQLEAWVGTQLLHRTTRRVHMTEDGRAFYERCKDLLADLDEARHMFDHDTLGLRGRLRVDMSSGTAVGLVLPHLGDFLQAHPGLELELSCTDRRVDVVREGFDCVLRGGHVGDTQLVARPLGTYAMVNCASPDYLRRHGMPRDLADLERHRLVRYAATLGQTDEGFEYFDGGAWRQKPMAGAVTVNNVEAYTAACLAGLGIIQTPLSSVRELLQTGRLVEILPALTAEPLPVTLLYPHRRHLPRRVQAFMGWLAELLQPSLQPLP